jgi:hypothetical protein
MGRPPIGATPVMSEPAYGGGAFELNPGRFDSPRFHPWWSAVRRLYALKVAKAMAAEKLRGQCAGE